MVAIIGPPLPPAGQRLRKDVAACVTKALERYSKGDVVGALEAQEEALKLAPSEPIVLLGRGILLINLGRHTEALEDLEEAEYPALIPEFLPELYMGRAIALSSLGRDREAIAELEKAPVGPSAAAIAELRQEIVIGSLVTLAKSGFASWAGGKPKGSKRLVKLTPGPSITELVREGRR
jgi:tetratricopeptide (TPR) repeat protein